jgi:hypothetical protein
MFLYYIYLYTVSSGIYLMESIPPGFDVSGKYIHIYLLITKAIAHWVAGTAQNPLTSSAIH